MMKKIILTISILSLFILTSCMDTQQFFTGDFPTESSPGWNQIEEGTTHDSFTCTIDNPLQYGQTKCKIMVSSPCEIRNCIQQEFVYTNTCLYSGEKCKSAISFNNRGQCWVHVYVYGCPSYDFQILPPSPYKSETITVDAINSYYAVDQSSQWISIPLNTVVSAQGKTIKYQKWAHFACDLIGLHYPGETECGDSNSAYYNHLYEWIDLDGDGCGETKQLKQICQSGWDCSAGTCNPPSYPGCTSENDLGKVECLSDTKQRTCTYSDYYFWTESDCYGAETCMDGAGCGCWGIENPCPDNMAVGSYICTQQSPGEWQKCILKSGCRQLSQATLCDAGQDCIMGIDSTKFPCQCTEHYLNDISCSNSNIGEETCIMGSLNVNEIWRCTLDGQSCPYWKKSETCDIGQTCTSKPGLSGLTEYYCECPEGMCASGERFCVTSDSYSICQTYNEKCGYPSQSMPCGTGETCENGYCVCANECVPSTLGCSMEAIYDSSGQLTSYETYPAVCDITIDGCAYWRHISQSCESQKLICENGKCIPPFSAIFSRENYARSPLKPNTDFYYKMSEDIHATLRLRDARGVLEEKDLKYATIKWDIVDCGENSNNCDGISSITSSVNFIGVLSSTKEGEYTFKNLELSDGKYYIRAVVRVDYKEYGPFYQEITVGNTIAMSTVGLVTPQYTSDQIVFSLRFKTPQDTVITSQDISGFSTLRYKIGDSSWKYSIISNGEREGIWSFQFTETTPGKVTIEIKPIISNPVFVVETYTITNLILNQPTVKVNILTSLYGIGKDESREITFETVSPTKQPITNPSIKVYITPPVGMGSAYWLDENRITAVSGYDNRWKFRMTFDQTPTYYIRIDASQLGYGQGQSCPGTETNPNPLGCPVDVKEKPIPYWLYITIASAIVIIILFFIFRRRKK